MEAGKILLRAHFPKDLNCPGQEQQELKQVPEMLDQGTKEMDLRTDEFLQYIAIEKVKNARRPFGSKKAPSPDGFKPIVLKNLDETAGIFLTELYKMSII